MRDKKEIENLINLYLASDVKTVSKDVLISLLRWTLGHSANIEYNKALNNVIQFPKQKGLFD